MASQDIILDSNYDLLVEDGDFALGRSEEQEIDLILIAAPGIFVSIQQWESILLCGSGVRISTASYIRRLKPSSGMMALRM